MNDLKPEQFAELRTAYLRLVELRSKKSAIISKESQSQAEEIKTLEQYVGSFLLNHAGQFISSYSVIKNEYEPLVMILAPRFTAHAMATIQQVGALQQEQREKAAASVADAPAENVVPLQP